VEADEREAIVRALKEAHGIVGGPNGAAARPGLKRTTLHSRMQKLNISRQYGRSLAPQPGPKSRSKDCEPNRPDFRSAQAWAIAGKVTGGQVDLAVAAYPRRDSAR
jgi:hypothetical protein